MVGELFDAFLTAFVCIFSAHYSIHSSVCFIITWPAKFITDSCFSFLSATHISHAVNTDKPEQWNGLEQLTQSSHCTVCMESQHEMNHIFICTYLSFSCVHTSYEKCKDRC